MASPFSSQRLQPSDSNAFDSLEARQPLTTADTALRLLVKVALHSATAVTKWTYLRFILNTRPRSVHGVNFSKNRHSQ